MDARGSRNFDLPGPTRVFVQVRRNKYKAPIIKTFFHNVFDHQGVLHPIESRAVVPTKDVAGKLVSEPVRRNMCTPHVLFVPVVLRERTP